MARTLYVFLAVIAGLALINDIFFVDTQSRLHNAGTGQLPTGWRPTQASNILSERFSGLDGRKDTEPESRPIKTVENVSIQLAEAEDRIQQLQQDITVRDAHAESLQKTLDDERSRTSAIQTNLDSSRIRLQQAEGALRTNVETRHWLMLIARRNRWMAQSRYQDLAARFEGLEKEAGERDGQISIEKARSHMLERELEAARDHLSKGMAQNETGVERGITSPANGAAGAGGSDQHMRAEYRSLAQALALEQSKVNQLTMSIALMHEQRNHEGIVRKVRSDASYSDARDRDNAGQDAPHIDMLRKQGADDALRSVDGNSVAETASSAGPNTTKAEVSLNARLSEAVSAHVVLHFASNNDASREKAISLASTLSAQGIDVYSLAGNVADKSGIQITYFYAEDTPVAKELATKLAATGPVRAGYPVPSTPRPGTINVWVGG